MTPHRSTLRHCCRRACPRRGQMDRLAKYSFIGGNNDPDQSRLRPDRCGERRSQARGQGAGHLRPRSGPQGYRPLRDFLTAKLKRDAGIDCVADES